MSDEQKTIIDMICKRINYFREKNYLESVKVRIADIGGEKVYVEYDKKSGAIRRAIRINKIW